MRAYLRADGSGGTVATGCAGPAGEAASAATARYTEIGVDGVGFGAGDTWLDKPTEGPSASSEGDRLEGGGQLFNKRGVGE